LTYNILAIYNYFDIQCTTLNKTISGKEFYCQEIRETKWGSQNCYWDEKTIDIQWKKNQDKIKRSYYTTGLTRKPE
jgi:hypothetical protein